MSTVSFDSIREDVASTGVNAYSKGFHPSASGNISAHLPEDALPPSSEMRTDPWKDFSNEPLTKLGGEHFLVTASGQQLKNLERKPDTAMGVVEFNEDGTKFRQVWGFANGTVNPTSEFDTHARSHNIGDGPGAVYHGHPTHTNTLMKRQGVIRDWVDATQIVWQGTTEGAVYVPGGVAHIPWCIPGTVEIAELTAKAFIDGASAVLWDRHGMFVKHGDIETAFGVVETVEDAMETHIGAIYEAGEVDWLTMGEIGSLVDYFAAKLAANPNDSPLWQLLEARELSSASDFGLDEDSPATGTNEFIIPFSVAERFREDAQPGARPFATQVG